MNNYSIKLSRGQQVYNSLKVWWEEPGKWQPFQDGCQRFQEIVNLPSKKTVNCIRKEAKNCQPKSGKDICAGHCVLYWNRL